MSTATETKEHNQVHNTTNKQTIDFGTPQYVTVTKTVAYGYQLDDKGQKVAIVLPEDEANKLSDEGKFEGSVVTTTTKLPANWAAVREMENKTYLDTEGNPRDIKEVLDEVVTLFRPGMSVKATNRRNQLLLETDSDGNFTFDESTSLKNGYLDLTDEITSPSKRVFRTEEQKIWESISNLDPVRREAVWRAYLGSTGKEFYLPQD